ncbi:hypothetical protein FRAHR75_580022 [Frankia sp. Hr75.2]|nr:hypothetical protein FRAHR75_580022 [Frankia sp. Hr75.2]
MGPASRKPSDSSKNCGAKAERYQIDDPDDETRRTIDSAKRHRLVPEGHHLRHTGRDRGNRIIRLSDDTDWNRIRLHTRPRRRTPMAEPPETADLGCPG